ncbi:dihydroxyacetone kinase subunit L [Streptomyces sp. SID8382]|uniref:dihydroxyacetone kinase subunit DhaL n=2 Tax=Streptomyces malaysiensis TaxID=92644 RepID=UPI000C2BB33F|nr:dihydroxyacetone kinase subunit DhaL [Streptomyces sp. M56]AUA16969.1 PTS-dependent dihydroxyacetone kinase, ADP-binding subunit DhaL [Streptomyces sp. M56]MYX61547.1 dihydroxyacetone kinase subunit L [Streptomyces sp. SID8382]
MSIDQRRLIQTYAHSVHMAHDTLTALDQLSGDGDFGDNLREGIDQVTTALDAAPTEPAFTIAARVFLDEVGGTSGPLIGLLFQEIAHALADDNSEAGWAAGVREGMAAIQRVGEAQAGDRTMVDALLPACDALAAGGDAHASALAALNGAKATASLRARRGRASYVGERVLGAPDPGAVGVALLFWSRAKVLEQEPGVLADILSPGQGLIPADLDMQGG